MALDADFLAAVVENVAHPIFVKDREFRFVLVNDAMCEACGHPRSAFLGKTDYDVFAKEEADFFRLKDEEMFRSESRVVIEEERITDSSGRVHVLATTKVPMRDTYGNVTHLVGIIKDITALKEQQDELERRVAERTEQLREAQAELLRKERLAMLGELAGGVAHQLRNPLGALINAASILRRRPLDDMSSEVVDILDAEAWRANRIVEDLLSYARIRAPRTEEVALDELLDGVVHAVAHGEVRVSTSSTPGVWIRVDPQQLGEAIRNLVTNAIEAAQENVWVRSRRCDDQVVIEIVDDGPGMSADSRGRLFEPLFTTKAYGLGLGLTTARSLVENQGGAVRCSRTGPEGTTFEVEVPCA